VQWKISFSGCVSQRRFLFGVLVREIPGPLNIMAGLGMLSAPELFRLGITLVSIGGAVMLATMGLVRAIAHELQEHGTYAQMARNLMSLLTHGNSSKRSGSWTEVERSFNCHLPLQPLHCHHHSCVITKNFAIYWVSISVLAS